MENRHPPLFSIIIPTYNYASYLTRTLGSILSQDEDDYEVVVIDDGSTDSTAQVVRENVSQASGKIIYAFQENQGPAAARNYGVRLSSGKYLIFLDADDAMLPNALWRFRSVIEKHNALDFVWGGHILVHFDGRTKYRSTKPLSRVGGENFLLYLRSGPGLIYPGTIAMRRYVFHRIRWPEATRIWADVVFYSHLLALFSGTSFSDPVVMIHMHSDSLQHNLELVREYRLKTVDLLFNPDILPANLMPMRDEYFSLTLFRLINFFYKRRNYGEALHLFHYGLRSCPWRFLRAKRLKNYLRIFLKLAWQRIWQSSEASNKAPKGKQ